MAKLRSDYGSRIPGKLGRWVREGSGVLDGRMQRSLSESAAQGQGENEREAEREARLEALRLRETENERELYRRMHGWMDSRGFKWIARAYRIAATVVAVMIIGVLLATVAELPRFGDSNAPVVNEVSDRYIEKGLEETGAVNVVAGMILDYRAFDTLGESNVLFIAVCSVFILLRVNLDENGRVTREKLDAEANDRRYEPHKDTILQRMADVLTPVILLFGVYIMLNGHLSPGGGFSGGAVTGAGLILYLNAHGYSGTRSSKLFRYGAFRWVTFTALMFYCLSKCYSFFTGANHMESGIPKGVPGSIFSSGLILPLNICVGFVVAFTMYGFYTLFRKGDF